MPALARRLGLTDAVVIGLSAMLGAGVFVAFAPAASLAGGPLLLAALAVAGVVAYCNASSSAALAALHPESGGTYVYGRERLGPFWGFLAGWGFVVGKTASCAAMALTIGAYLWPEYARPVGIAAVTALTAVNLRGVAKTALAAKIFLAVTAAVLVLVAAVGVGDLSAPLDFGTPAGGLHGVLGAAGLMFFAFAGYARIATLGEEVREPARTIPRAIGLALAVVVVLYAILAVIALLVLGPALPNSTAPLADVVTTAGLPGLAPVVRVGAGIAVVGVLLSLLAGVGRTTLAMARRRDLPGFLAAVHPVRQVPHRAELAVGVLVAVLVAVTDLRGVIGFSSFAVLGYYAVANASAWTLGGRWRRIVAGVGLVGCLVVGFSLPWRSLAAGAALLAVGAVVYAVRRRA
ncbi:APC family permease [Phytomonospora endophytica]|uniref:APA family basic amino acid/polyamine antiporter n=1 Tax=Phytomonospora endophytica TaxID=714109 RepID=A0A841FST5_9ACTN|nr:APC family permease [Phytomonospora endophytica]MBB6039345.1 APA family basic amino acid/polyamine antiporter [Phytomonospora endophytica]